MKVILYIVTSPKPPILFACPPLSLYKLIRILQIWQVGR